MIEKSEQLPQPAVNRTDVAIAIITRAGRVLICKRPAGGSFPGYWEFPGGKREAGETVEGCLRREVREELAMQITPLHALSPIDHDYPRGPIRLHPFVCSHDAGEPQLLACEDAAWVDPHDLARYQFPPANDSLLAEAVKWLTSDSKANVAPRPG